MMNPQKYQEQKTKARLLSDLDLEDEEPQWKFMRLSPSPTLDQVLSSTFEEDVPQRVLAEEDANSLVFDVEDFLINESTVPLVPHSSHPTYTQQSVANQPLLDLLDTSLFYEPMTPPPMEDQAKEADLPSLLEIGDNIAAMPLSTTTTTTTTAAPLQQLLPPFAVHTFQCATCHILVKASSLFAKNPSCPNCTTTCLQSITNATASMFELVATCRDGHTCNQSCLKRSDNANRVCPYFGCTSSLKYTCKKCGKQGSYQCLTKKNHKCFDEHRRKGGSAK